ncbi:MAG: chemotaxis protein CheC, partial [Oscillospiraceae bacterium]|nr:chemotaxis protein CheC [Oscillospiraceae bacterium]
DTLREVGSIGTGNAATALSTLLNKEVRIALPEVRFMGYNEAIEWMGGPEVVTAGVLVGMSNQMSGIMLSVQHLEFINLVLESMLGDPISDYAELDEMRQSTLVEVGNIMISTFINALSGLSDISVNLTVPAFAVDMQGAILSVPMAEYGGTSDYIMTIAGHFVCDGKQVPCHLILSPDLRSLNFLLKKLGVAE